MARTSATLLERLRVASDEAAWERFVEIYGPLVYRWLRQYGLQHQDARDVGQEVLIAVVREMPKFRYEPGKGSFRGWLKVTMLNRLRTFWSERTNKPAGWGRGDTMDEFEQLADPDSQLARRWDDQHDRHVLARLLEMLKGEFEPTTWQAFWRSAVDGEKAAVVAGALGISANAVYLAKSHVLRRLREESAGFLDEE